jgi:hypothetical protein
MKPSSLQRIGKRVGAAERLPAALKRAATLLLSLAVGCAPTEAQVLEAPVAPGQNAPPASPPASSAQKPAAGGILGTDLPRFDPGSETLTWDGRIWNIHNNRLFAARFEKYLNAPEATTTDDRQYQAVINEILNRLAPGAANQANVDYAFRLLPRGSNYDGDARLCDALADAVYTVWMAQRQQQRLYAANQAMQYEVMSLEAATRSSRAAAAHAKDAAEKMKTKGARGSQNAQNPQGGGQTSAVEEAADAGTAVQDSGNWQTRRLTEMIARQKANDVKRELSEIQAKVEFQALMVQFFLQRRFQHVLMATRFYRALFSDGDSKLNVGQDTRDLFMKSSGMPPTVTTLDSLANEAIRDVREGVRAFDFLLQNNELESATKRLAEAFTVGEYLPEIRTLPREKKRQALEFSQKSNQLISAIEVKDYGLAEKLVKDLAVIAKDFDSSKPMAAIETARTVAQMRLAKARNAALSGDRQTLEAELAAATELWPRNPALADVSKTIFDQGDVQQRAISDLDQLLSQKNYRSIFDDSARYIAATAIYPERRDVLKKVLADMQTIEAAILRAEEMRRQNNHAGAWESVERIAGNFPSDSKLSQVRADLTTQAADFVRTLRSAQDLEKKEQVGSSLAWYLKAQRLYPPSEFAQEGIDRLKKKILPDG